MHLRIANPARTRALISHRSHTLALLFALGLLVAPSFTVRKRRRETAKKLTQAPTPSRGVEPVAAAEKVKRAEGGVGVAANAPPR